MVGNDLKWLGNAPKRVGNGFSGVGNGLKRVGTDLKRVGNGFLRVGNDFLGGGNGLTRVGNGFLRLVHDFLPSGNGFSSIECGFDGGKSGFPRPLNRSEPFGSGFRPGGRCFGSSGKFVLSVTLGRCGPLDPGKEARNPNQTWWEWKNGGISQPDFGRLCKTRRLAARFADSKRRRRGMFIEQGVQNRPSSIGAAGAPARCMCRSDGAWLCRERRCYGHAAPTALRALPPPAQFLNSLLQRRRAARGRAAEFPPIFPSHLFADCFGFRGPGGLSGVRLN